MSVPRCPIPNFMLSNTKKSEFHQSCVPSEARRPPATAPVASGATAVGATASKEVVLHVNQVALDEQWKECVKTEQRGIQEWKENWGFLTDYDDKGRAKSAKSLPERVNMYSDTVPNTVAGSYGSRINTQLGQTMQNLEFNFYSGHRKKKADDLICY